MKIIISTNQILELLELARQAQANISQKTEIESQDRKDNKSKESQNNQTVEEVNQRLEAEDTEDEQRLQAEIAQLQSQNQNQDDITSTDLTLRPCAKGELYDIGPYVGTAGESRVSHESCDAPSPSRVQSTIVEGGVEGDPVTREIEQGIDIRKSTGRLDDDDHRGAITIKSALKTEGLTTRAPLAEELTVDDYNALDNNDYSQEELMEELMEEPRVGSVDQQKENIEDLSSDFITSGPDLGHDQMHDFDDIHALLDEINSITLNGANRNGNCPHDPGGDLASDLAESSWGHDPHINPWGSLDKSAISGFVIDPENLDTDVGEGEVDEDPPTRSEYDQTNKGESITIMEVIAGTDVKKKDDTVVVATEGSYLSPYKALLRAGDFVFTGQPPGGRLSPRAVSTGGASSAPFPFGG